MARRKKKKEKIIKLDDIYDERVVDEYEPMWNRAKAQMENRTVNFEYFAKVSHMKNLYNDDDHQTKMFSEGSTQAIKRKIRSQTLQRTPDGELIDQYDKNSIEHAILEYIFDHKILENGISGNNLFKKLTKTFNGSYDYGFSCVRTGFDKDGNGDIYVTYNIIKYDNVFPAPDCDAIEEAAWYIIREWISRSDLTQLIDDKGNVDPSYNADTVKYLLQNEYRDGDEWEGSNIQDDQNGVSKTESVEVRTLYKKGSKEFVTYVPSLDAVLRTTKNYDPQKEVPLHFLILEPDDEYPLGVSSVMWTLSQQQFSDAFQTSAYNNLLLATNPPVMVWGNQTQHKLKMLPRSVWNMGNNPNATKVEKFPVETTALTQFGSTLEQTSAQMARNMNIQDQTIASDAHVPGWSKTPQGVEQQQKDKTITINTFQKNIEIFFCDWANHALRSYVSAMSGSQQVTVDEETRRKIDSIERSQVDPLTQEAPKSIIDGNKITIDFDTLSAESVEFKVRAGSLIQGRKEEQMKKIQDLIVPISQMLGALPDEDKSAFTQTLMQMVKRLLEDADIDIAAEVSQRIDSRLVIDSLKATMAQVAEQNAVQEKMAQQIQQIQRGKGALPPQQQQPQQAPKQQPQPQQVPPQPQEMQQQQQQEPPLNEQENNLPPEQNPGENPMMGKPENEQNVPSEQAF